jgi:hypothetical protein
MALKKGIAVLVLRDGEYYMDRYYRSNELKEATEYSEYMCKMCSKYVEDFDRVHMAVILLSSKHGSEVTEFYYEDRVSALALQKFYKRCSTLGL